MLPVGTPVAVQNQTGRNPTKWDKTGVVVENKPHSQVLVRVDGSRKATLRNRKYVKQIIPPVSRHPTTPPRVTAPAQVMEPVPPDSPDQYSQCDDDTAAVVSDDNAAATVDIPGDDMDQSSSAAPIPVHVPSPVTAPVPTPTRPRREIKPNRRYDPDIYDLSKTDAKMMDTVGSGLRQHRRGRGAYQNRTSRSRLLFRVLNKN